MLYRRLSDYGVFRQTEQPSSEALYIGDVKQPSTKETDKFSDLLI
jgi:hypothetical protein